MISRFLTDLFADGQVQVDQPGDDESDVAPPLIASEALRRQDFPGQAPDFSLQVARWAATLFYRACQAATFRDLPPSELDRLLDVPPPPAEHATRHYSVDLVFQFLPDLLNLAGQPAPDDPLVTKLRQWANEWPLSSVGVKNVVPVSLAGIVDHPGMLQDYVDRVIDRRDSSRLAAPVVAAAVRRSLGLHLSRFPEAGVCAADVHR